jgi:glycosyltransferase involved in cell wall biosynthesis
MTSVDDRVATEREHRPKPTASVRDVTVVVPARNAAALLPACLASVRESGVAEVIVVDGLSTDDTVEIARSHGAVVLSDEGLGLPVARARGAEHASTRWVALIDADVVVPENALAALLEEYVEDGYSALQAGQRSVSGDGYWGRALTHHHRTGRSRRWFGLVATLFERDILLSTGFDDRFKSGEDIELRWRMRAGGHRVGVSDRVFVEHRFAGDDFAFARSQFLMDGEGFGKMVRKHRLRGALLLALPAAAGVRGAGLSLLRLQPQWLPYFAAFVAYNYLGLWRGLRR